MKTSEQLNQGKTAEDINAEVGEVFSEVRKYYWEYYTTIEKKIAEKKLQRQSHEVNTQKGKLSEKGSF